MKKLKEPGQLKKNLLHLQQFNNLTASYLEKEICGVGRSNWSLWVDLEKTQTPSVSHLEKLAQYFRVSVSELLDTDLTTRKDLPKAREVVRSFDNQSGYGLRQNNQWGIFLNQTDSIKFRPEFKDLILAASERFVLPAVFGLTAEHLMFRYFGESCSPIFTSDDQLIAVLADDAEEATIGKVCIVPTNSKVFFGKVTIVDENTIKVTPLNPEFKSTNIPLVECPYIYRVLGRIQFGTSLFM